MAISAQNSASTSLDERASLVFSIVVVAVVMIVGVTWLRDDPYALRLLSLSGIFAILSLALRLTYAEVGELNLGQGVLFGVGAYAVAIAGAKFHLGPLTGGVIGMAGAAILALIVSVITLRLTGAFFAVATLGLVPVATAIIVNADDVTGGVLGLGNYGGGVSSPAPIIGIPGQLAWMVAIWILTLGVILIDHWLRACRFGQSLNAIRQDPMLFASLGFNVTTYKVTAAVISGTLAGLAGNIFALHEGLVSASVIGLPLLATIIIIVVAGGSRVPGGVVAASIIVTIVPEYARILGDYRLFAFGIALIVMLKFSPDGVGPWVVQWIARVTAGSRKRPEWTR